MERSSSTSTEILDMTISTLTDLKRVLMIQKTRLLNDLLLESAKGHSNVTLRIIQEGATNLSECLLITNDQTCQAFKNMEWTL